MDNKSGIGSDNDLATTRRQAIILLVYWLIYASLGLNELTKIVSMQGRVG